RRRGSATWQLYGNGSSSLGVALNCQGAVMQLDEPFCNAQPEALALLFLHFSIKLHVGSNAADMFRGKTSTPIRDTQKEFVRRRTRAHFDWCAGSRKLESVLDNFIDNSRQVIL